MPGQGSRILFCLIQSVINLILIRMPHALVLLALSLVVSIVSQVQLVQAQNRFCYTVADAGGGGGGNDLLNTFDLVTLTETGVGNTGTSNIEAISYDYTSGTLYAVNANDFGTLDTSTGAFSSITILGTANHSTLGSVNITDVDGLGFDSVSGNLWAAQRLGGDDILFQIEPTTGAIVPDVWGPGDDYLQPSLTATFGMDDVDSISTDPTTGIIYITANSGSNTTEQIVTVDRLTGAITAVTGAAGTTVGDTEELTFDLTGQMIGTTGASGANTNTLYFYDKSTGLPLVTPAPTVLGPPGSDYEAVTCLIPVPGNGFNTIEGTVFLDANTDGSFNGSDTGQAGVMVFIYRDLDGSGTVNFGDQLFGTVETDSNGNYSSTVLTNEDFVIEIDTGDLPTGSALTTDNVEVANFVTFGSVDSNNNFGFSAASVQVEKATNGQDADTGTGPLISVGDAVTWTYIISNTGSFDLTNVTLNDDQEGNLTPSAPGIAGDTGDDGVLGVGETWTITQTGTATAGQYENIATVTGDDPSTNTVNDTDLSHYFGVQPSIEVQKTTNGADSDSAPGEILLVGEPVTWSYTISNTGNFALSDVTLVDDQEGNLTPVAPGISGDTGDDGVLGTGETWIVTQSGTATAGQYTNTATVTGEDPSSTVVNDTDTSNYFGSTTELSVLKTSDVVGNVTAGQTITYTIEVVNLGTTTQTNVLVTDPGANDSLFASGSTSVTYPIDGGLDNVLDLFNSELYSNNDGSSSWTTDWVENQDTDSDGPTTGDIFLSEEHDFVLQVGDDNNSITREADLSGASAVTLKLRRRRVSLENNDGVRLYVTTDNTASCSNPIDTNDWDLIDSYLGSGADANFVAESYSLLPGQISATTSLCFITPTGNMNNGDIVYFDDIEFELDNGETIRDNFYTETYSANHGSNTWNAPWTEDDDGSVTGGDVQVTDSVSASYTLFVGNDDSLIHRSADLSASGSATLSFVYRREGLDDVGESIEIYVTDDASATCTNSGGTYAQLPSPWVLLDALEDADDSEFTYVEYDISDYTTADTQICFRSKEGSMSSTEGVHFDDVEILSTLRIDTTEAGGNVPNLTSGLSNQIDLLPGESATITFESVVDNPLGGGVSNIANTATATSTEVPGGVSSTVTDPVGAAEITVEKSTNGQDADSAPGPNVALGSTVTWTYLVSNTGTQSLSSITLNDDQEGNLSPSSPGISGDTGDDGVLGVGETWTITQTGTALAGQYTNTATATGEDASTNVVSDTDDSNYFGVSSSIDVQKATNGQDADSSPGPNIASGSGVTWTYLVSNTGNAALTNVTLSDDQEGVLTPSAPGITGDTGDDGILGIGETWTVTQTGSASAGQYSNTATVTGDDPLSNTVNDTDDSHYFGVNSSINVEKATNGQDADSAPGPSITNGGGVTWTYLVSNTGNTALTNITLSDDQEGVLTPSAPGITGDTGNDGILGVGETWTVTQTGTASAGQYSNTATATGDDPLSSTVNDTDDSHYFGVNSSIAVEKATNGQDADSTPGPNVANGGGVTWTYLISNTGNAALTNVTLSDDQEGVLTPSAPGITGDTGDDGILGVGETWTVTQTGTASSGQYSNTATVNGDDPLSATVNDTDDSHYFGVNSSINVEKATNGQDADSTPGPNIANGGGVTWTYVISNTGNAALTNVTLSDDEEGVLTPSAPGITGDTGDDGVLGVGETWTVTQTGTASAGQYSNTATATGDDPLSTTVNDTDDSHYFGVNSSIDVEKATNGQDADATPGPNVANGGGVTWTYLISNTGNTALTSVTLSDDQEGVLTPSAPGITGDTGDDGVLGVGETWTVTESGTASSGQYANTATATGDDPLSNTVNDTDDSHYFGINSSIDVEKATNGQDADSTPGPNVTIGGGVTWTYLISNTGNAALTNVTLGDDQEGVLTPSAPGITGDTGDDGVLGVGETWTVTQSGTAAAGQYTNTATATGDDPLASTVNDSDDSHYFGVNSSIDVEKATNGQDADSTPGPNVASGGGVTWTYLISNNGNTSLTNITLSDNQEGVLTPSAPGITGDAGDDGVLGIGETWTVTQTGTASSGQYSNTATATGDDPLSNTVNDTDDSHYFGVNSSIDVEKATNGQDADSTPGPNVANGGGVTWTYVISNTGNAALTNVTLSDDQEGVLTPSAPGITGDTGDDGILGTGETWTVTQSGTASSGQYSNTATATGDDPLSNTVNDTDDSHYFGINSSINVEKATNGQDADSTPGPNVANGGGVTWTYVISNTGNAALTGVTLSDDQEGVLTPSAPGITGDTGDDGILGIGETWTVTQTGTASSGQYANTATVTGDDPLTTTVNDTDDSHYFGINSSVNVEKATNGQDADSTPGPNVANGGGVTWTYLISNDGNSALTNVTLSDDQEGVLTPTSPGITGDTGDDGILGIGETWTVTQTGTASSGQYANTATATGDDPLSNTVNDTDDSHYFGLNSSIDVEKSTNGQDADSAPGPSAAIGSAVTWTYLIANSGNVDLTNVTLSDDQEGVLTPSAPGITGDTGDDGILGVGETWTVTQTGTASAGQYANTATATGDDPLAATVNDTDDSHYFGVSSAINVEKATNGQDADSAPGPNIANGGGVTWTYSISNAGNTPLTNVTLSDDQEGILTPSIPGITGDTGDDGVLGVGETWTVTQTGTASSGQYANTATVTGDDPLSNTVNDTDDSHYFGINSSIDVEKATNGQDADSAPGPNVANGGGVTWTYLISNNGNATLTNVTLSDDQEGVLTPTAPGITGDTGDDGILGVGETWTVTQTDTASSGQYANTATATGDDPLSTTVNDTDDSHYFGINSSIDVEKATNGQDADTTPGPSVANGGGVTWTYLVSNNGNSALTNVTLSDDQEGTLTPTAPGITGDTGDDGILGVGETWTVTQAGTASSGQYMNTATATGDDPLSNTVNDTDDSHYFGINSSIDVEKATNGQDADSAPGPNVANGGGVTWTYLISNTGNAVLTNVTLSDDQEGVLTPSAPGITGDTGDDGILGIGETWTLTQTGTASSGQYTNTATATGDDPLSTTVNDTDDSHYFGINSSINVEKATNGQDADSTPGPNAVVGSTVTWTYAISNSGNADLTNVTLSDDQEGVLTPSAPGITGDTGDDGVLSVGETWTVTQTGIATTGQYANTATATGDDPLVTTVNDTDDSHYFGVDSAINVEKATNGQDADTAPGPNIANGAGVTWTYTVSNAGNTPLTNVTLGDDQEGVLTPTAPGIAGDTGDDGVLGIGETWTVTLTGTATTGQYANTATATGDDPLSNTVNDSDDSHYFGLNSSINVEKSTNGQDADNTPGPNVANGGGITWTYLVSNSGNAALTNVTLSDDQEGVLTPSAPGITGDTGDDGILGVGETWTVTQTGTATDGQYANTATATGDDPLSNTVNDTDDSHYFGINSSIDVEKATNGQDADSVPGPNVSSGAGVTWTYLISNSGNAPLTSVTLSDDQEGVLTPSAPGISGDTGDDGVLGVGETWTVTQSGTATTGQYANTASVTGVDPLAATVNDSDDSHYFGLNPDISVEKATNGQDADSVPGPSVATGGGVTWTYLISNVGNTPLTSVTLSDDQEGVLTPSVPGITGDTGDDGVLGIGETWTVTQTGTATTGQYENTATATGQDALATTVNDTDDSHYFGINSSINVEKATNGQDADTGTGPLATVGSTVTWTYVVSNTGNADLDTVTLVDDQEGTLTPTAPGITGDTGDDGILGTGETWIVTQTGLATVGQYVNTATVTGDDPLGDTVNDSDDSHYFGVNSAINVEKSTNGQDADLVPGPSVVAGSTVTWVYAIANIGNENLTNVTLVDDIEGTLTPTSPGITGDSGDDGELGVGETWLVTATGTATAGQYANTATVTGTDALTNSVNDSDDSHYFGVDSSINVEKATNGQDADTAPGPNVANGGGVTWTYLVSNNGNVALTNVTLADDQEGVLTPTAPGITGDTGDDGILGIGETWTVLQSGTATSGQYTNTATATGVDTLATTVNDTDDSHYFGVNSSIDVEKSTNGQDADAAPGPSVAVGSTVTWTYFVANSGNVPLTNVTLSDDQEGVLTPSAPGITGDTGDDGVLGVGETWTITQTGTATAGQYANTATATGDDPLSITRNDTDDSHYFGVDPSIDVEKATNGQDADTVPGPNVTLGAPVTWTYVISNTGNVELSNVTLADNQEGVLTPTAPGISGDTGDDGVLGVGETWTVTQTGSASAGQYANTGTVTGRDTVGTVVNDSDDSHYFGVNSSIDVEKATNDQDADTPTGPSVLVGSAVTWTYVLTNNGNVDLTNITLLDSIEGNVLTLGTLVSNGNGNATLEVGESWTYTISDTATFGQYSNTATASGLDPFSTTVNDTDNSHYVGTLAPGINVEKSTNGIDADAPTGPTVLTGSTVTWTYIVTNTGNAALQGVTVTDNDVGVTPSFVSGDDNPSNGILDLTETWTYQATGIAQAGQYSNIGTASGQDITTATVSDTDMSHYLGVTQTVSIEKFTNGQDSDTAPGENIEVGAPITWTYVITNPGPEALVNITVTDSDGSLTPTLQNGDLNLDNILDVGETWTYSATGTATVGAYMNLGTVRGLDTGGNPVSDDDESHYTGFQLGMIGDQVFLDTNGNGIFEPSSGENGISGVGLTLYNDVNGNGIADTGDLIVGNTSTDSNGLYSFDDLPTDDGSGSFNYIVVVSSPPADHTNTSGSVGVNNNSQDEDGYAVNLTPTSFTDFSADFGYQPENSPPIPGCNGNDFDGDGILDDFDIDIDGDGILNTEEGFDDLDGDSLPNATDLDSDGDGLGDLFEGQIIPGVVRPSGLDSDNDGLDDAFDSDSGGTPIVPLDFDGDGTPDYKDIDSDNDGIDDNFELQNSDTYFPPSGIDSDCDGLDDSYDPQSDNQEVDGEFDSDDSGQPDFRETPLECSDLNLLPTAFGIDGASRELANTVKRSTRLRGRLGNQGTCSPLSSREQNRKIKQANELHLTIWVNAWSIPGRHYPCQSELPLDQCFVFDTLVPKAENAKASRQLNKMVRNLFKSCNSVKKITRLKRRARRLNSSIQERLQTVPEPVLVCER